MGKINVAVKAAKAGATVFHRSEFGKRQEKIFLDKTEKLITDTVEDATGKPGGLKEDFDKDLAKYLKKTKSAPLTEREKNERLLKIVGEKYSQASGVATVGGKASKLSGATGNIADKVAVAGVAATATGIAASVAAPTAAVAKKVGLAASGVNYVSNIVTDKAANKADAILEEAVQITRVPPKDDILVHFSANKDKYVKFCYLSNKKFAAVPMDETLWKYLGDNFSRIGGKTVNSLFILYFGYPFMSEDNKKWIKGVFGYIVSSVTMIPHTIPNIGFADDKIVIAYVLDRVGEAVPPNAHSQAITLKEALQSEVKAKHQAPKDIVVQDNEITANKTHLKNMSNGVDTPQSEGSVRVIMKF